jgi:DNA repair protein RadC
MSSNQLNKKLSYYEGHRKRLKNKLLNANDYSGFDDCEFLELILFFCIPRRDVKPIAKELLYTFGNLKSVVNADYQKLKSVPYINENVFIIFLIIKEFMNRILRHNVINQNIINSWEALLNYLKISIGLKTLEEFHVLFLNKKNCLIADEAMSIGTIDQTFVYPREIIKRVLFYDASAIILVHNHPSGVSKPSKSDIDLTNRIVEACNAVSVLVHDHVIVTSSEYFSFKSNMML